MANWDLVTAFNSESADWLDGVNLPHPMPSVSRMPTTQRMKAAWQTFDTAKALLIDGFDWDDPDYIPGDGFKMRGNRKIQLYILKSICKYCGQLLMYPDTGEPAIIVDETIEPSSVAHFHEECNKHDDSWERFYRGQYAT